MTQGSATPITVIGAGLAGCLLAILLAKRGHQVHLFERLADMRRTHIPAGRSINLALASRGIRALESAGVMPNVLPLLIPMPGRLVHDLDGALNFVAYGQREHEVIYSVSRPALNRILLDAAENAGVHIRFGATLAQVDFKSGLLSFVDSGSATPWQLPLQRVIGADGAGSVLRRALADQLQIRAAEDLLPHQYKELTLPARPGARHRLEKNALHIWPRGGFMLIALPNLDGSFTMTLFLPAQGALSFESLTDAAKVRTFFSNYFADVCDLIPSLAEQFAANPAGIMGTVHCDRWAVEDRVLLIGDAAHAITPFHGQGMNCAFEDCRELDEILQREPDWLAAFRTFEAQRRPNTDAIASMALENYVEMRDTVRDPKFLLHKALSLDLERRFPDRFVPRYSMVMFHDEIPYSVALERGRIQEDVLAQLTRYAQSLAEVDEEEAHRLIQEKLPPIAR